MQVVRRPLFFFMVYWGKCSNKSKNNYKKPYIKRAAPLKLELKPNVNKLRKQQDIKQQMNFEQNGNCWQIARNEIFIFVEMVLMWLGNRLACTVWFSLDALSQCLAMKKSSMTTYVEPFHLIRPISKFASRNQFQSIKWKSCLRLLAITLQFIWFGVQLNSNKQWDWYGLERKERWERVPEK